MPRRRRAGGSISVNVDVDVELYEVLEEIHDDDLKAECERRGIYVNPKQTGSAPATSSAGALLALDWEDIEADLRATLRDGNRLHFEVVLLRVKAMVGIPHEMTSGLKRDESAAALSS